MSCDHTVRGQMGLPPFGHLHVVDPGQFGSCLRAQSAARTNVVRKSALPALDMAWPLRSVLPVSDALGARPVKERK